MIWADYVFMVAQIRKARAPFFFAKPGYLWLHRGAISQAVKIGTGRIKLSNAFTHIRTPGSWKALLTNRFVARNHRVLPRYKTAVRKASRALSERRV